MAEAAASPEAAAAALALAAELTTKKQAPHAPRTLALHAGLLIRLGRWVTRRFKALG